MLCLAALGYLDPTDSRTSHNSDVPSADRRLQTSTKQIQPGTKIPFYRTQKSIFQTASTLNHI